MQIYHFKSQRQDTILDPAGKFGEALAEMMGCINNPKSKVLETSAVKEFKTLHDRKHFPGLGYVKKLSMNITSRLLPTTQNKSIAEDVRNRTVRAVLT